MVNPPSEISLLSLACGWPLGANCSPFREWRRLQGLRVEDPSGARKGGGEPTPELGQAGRLGPIGLGPSGPARSPLRARGSSSYYALFPLHLCDFGDVILASKMEVLLA
jgi:hypothetical protein